MQRIQNILHKEMTRKEFLATVGFGLATLCGLSALLSMLGKENPWHQHATGYGAGSYGGKKEPRLGA